MDSDAKRQNRSLVLRIGVTTLGLYLIWRQVDFREVWATLLQAQLAWVLLALLMVVASLPVRAYRWLLLLRGIGVSIPFRRLVGLYLVGTFFNSFLPSGFGGDVIRVLEISKDVRGEVATGTVILDRLTGLIMLFVMALAAVPWRPARFPSALIGMIVLGSFLGSLGVVALMHGEWIRRLGGRLPGPLSLRGQGAVARLLSAIQQCGWRAVGGALAVSVWFNLMLSGWWLLAGLALGKQVSLLYYVLVMPILSVPLLVPSISGLGPTELLAPTLFEAVGLKPEAAVSLSLLVFILRVISGLPGAAVYVNASVRSRRSTWLK